MGKKYREIKTRLKENPIRDLLVVDDHKIRNAAFLKAKALLKKMENKEKKFTRFETEDQRLFANWRALTFRHREREVDSAQQAFKQLANFHNQVIAEAEMARISVPKAYEIIKGEQKIFESADADLRTRIMEQRRKRELHIEEQSRKDFHSEPGEEDFFGDSDFDDPDDRPKSATDDNEHGPLTPQEARDFSALAEIIDLIRKKGMDHLSFNTEEQTALLAQAGYFLAKANKITEFLAIWDVVNAKARKKFSQMANSVTGFDPHDSIATLRRHVKNQEKSHGEFDGTSEGEEFAEEAEDESPFAQHFIGRKSKNAGQGEKTEKIKLLFRQLVRKLHPDALPEKIAEEPWTKKYWGQIQEAYKNCSHQSLERLWNLTAVRLNDFSLLSLSAVAQIESELQSELTALEKNERSFRKSPAWGFSSLKDYAKLHKRTDQEFIEEIQWYQDQIDELKETHRYWELAARQAESHRQRRTRQPKRKVGKKQNAQSKTKSNWRDGQQQSLF